MRSEPVYAVRRDLLDMRHAVAPLPDICQRIMRYDVPAMDKNTQPYFRDIYDHTNILMDRIEALRETVKSVVESKMLMESMRQNDVMRRLAAWAAMLAVPRLSMRRPIADPHGTTSFTKSIREPL